MGQRLNLEITKNGKILANAYYHWSAYSTSSLELTLILINEFEKLKKSKDNDTLKAVKMLMSTGALLTESEFEQMKDKSFSFSGTVNRNDGLIGITEKAIKQTQYWAEGSVYVNLDTETVHFDCKWDFDETDYDDEEVSSKKRNATDSGLDNIKEIPFIKVQDLLECIKDCEKVDGIFKVKNNFYCSIY